MKKLFVMFGVVLAMVLCGFSVLAEETYESGKWNFEIIGENAVITGYNGTETDVYVPNKVSEGEKEYPVIKLGDNLFEYNTYLNSVTLGEGIKEIGASAFSGAANLVCIVTPESLETIGDNAFSDCVNFNSVILYDGVKSIGKDAFSGCGKLTIYCNENKAGHSYALANSIHYKILNPDAVPEIITQDGIEYYIMNGEAIAVSFENSRAEVIVPPTIKGYPVTDINDIFRGSAITSITLPNTLKAIDESAFSACSLSYITIPYGVETIGNYAFNGCSNLVGIEIADSVTFMGESMFVNCERLVNVKLSKGIKYIATYMFNSCDALNSIEIPEGVTFISSSAFKYCYSLSKVKLPESLKEIGSYAFSDCEKLESIEIPDNVGVIGMCAFQNCFSLKNVNLPFGIKVLQSNVFSDCSKLSEIDLPDSITTIGKYAFSGCNELYSVKMSSVVKKIGEYAFKDCNKLESVTIPESVTTMYTNSFPASVVLCVYEDSYGYTFAYENNLLYNIIKDGEELKVFKAGGITYFILNGEAVAIDFDESTTTVVVPELVEGYPVTEINRAFYECKSLTNVSLPKNLKRIKDYSFAYCYGLTNIEMQEGVTSVGNYAFRSCSKLTNIKIPDGVTTIGEWAFDYCTGLVSVDMPDSIISIGRNAFSNCSKLTNVNISKGITVLEEYVFDHCRELTDIEIPDRVTSIGESAFTYCIKLTEIKIPDSVTKIGKYAFSHCEDLSKVRMSANIERIEGFAFDGCKKLLSITLPKSLTLMYTSSVPSLTVLCVYVNSYAYTFSVDNDMLYHIMKEEDNPASYSPEIYIVDGIRYLISNGEAIAVYFDKSTKTVVVPETIEGYPVTEIKKAFYECRSLTEIKLPENLRKIGDYSFFYCDKLTSIEIPDGVNFIGESAFGRCSSLVNVKLPESLVSVSAWTFSSCDLLPGIEIPDNVTHIGEHAFSYCYELSDVKIPDSVVVIGENAFSDCYKLKTIKLPKGITEISDYLFSCCTALTEIEIPDSVVSIGREAFVGCYALLNIKLPDSLKNIGTVAFGRNIASETIVIPEGLTHMWTDSFPTTAILCVYENSYAHTFAEKNGLLYFIIRKTSNPEISYGSSISGTATYTNGNPVANTDVEILYDDGTLKETVKTDANGNYEFTYAEVGRYTIRITDSQGNTASEIVSVKRMNVFDVYLAGDTNLILKKGYRVSGTVLPAGAKVTLSDTKGNTIITVDVTDGAFVFTDIPRGEYLVKAENKNGSITEEIYVSDADITDLMLKISVESATVSGDTKIENRDGTYSVKVWVSIDLIDSEGNVVSHIKTDEDGKYAFAGIPLGSYGIVATASEMRPAPGGFDMSIELKGYGHIDVAEFTHYTVETIILREEKVNAATINGQATTNGDKGNIYLLDEAGNQIAYFETESNGKFCFVNIPDGVYSITAITKIEGMGFEIITVKDGVVHGNTHIKVRKTDKVSKIEEIISEVPDEVDEETAGRYKEVILQIKESCDKLSEKEQEQLSEDMINKLNRYISYYTKIGLVIPEGVTAENIESLIPSDVIGEEVEFILSVTEVAANEAGEDGINTEEEYENEKIKETGKNKKIAKYYDISLSMDEKNIYDIRKQTETNGKLKITMEIPEEYRGHKSYSFIHMHKGEALTLVDLDDNPDTVTFEIDKFSTFALAYSDEELKGEVAKDSATITYNENGMISVTSTGAGKLYVATYSGDTVSKVEVYDVTAGTAENICSFGEKQAAFIWNAKLEPMCGRFTLVNR